MSYTYEDQSWALHDLQRDLGETTDVAARRPVRVAALGVLLMAWLDRTEASLTTLLEGRDPLTLQVRGATYADGRVRYYPRRTTLTVERGAEVPLVLRVGS